MPSFTVSKTYGAERGLSCVFRQWQASDSHCRFLHGYALGVKLVFAADTLDSRGWVYDFGDAKWIWEFLQDTFDHKTCVSETDPDLPVFQDLADKGLIQLRILPYVGCERFAKYIADYVGPHLAQRTDGRVWLVSVEVAEHPSNAALYTV